MKITNEAVRQACLELLGEGITYDQMDCQAAVEEAYIRAGLSRKLVDCAGSNTHARKCYWVGTPERLCEILGIADVPIGVETYINVNDGGEPSKYHNDLMGDFTHMGLYVGDAQTFNSSEKMGGIVISEKFNGHDSVPNGGWNEVGLKDYVDYGLSDAQMAAIMQDGNFVPANYTGNTSAIVGDSTTTAEDVTEQASTPIDTSDFYTIKQGCKGGAVARLQEWLNDLGYGLDVDHDFGPATQQAAMQFQQQYGLVVDGVVGKKTWAALAQAKFNA